MGTVQKILWILIVAIVGVGIVGGLWWLASRIPKSTTPSSQTNQPTGSSGNLYPVVVGVSSNTTAGASTTQSTTQPGGQQVQTLDLKGNNVTVRTLDFTKDSTIESDSRGTYALAGGMRPNPLTTPYSTVYSTASQSFVVTLLQEPLGFNRSTAEQELQKQLGIDQSSMCQLNYYVGVPASVNERYAGVNLGFSFCPGATKLP